MEYFTDVSPLSTIGKKALVFVASPASLSWAGGPAVLLDNSQEFLLPDAHNGYVIIRVIGTLPVTPVTVYVVVTVGLKTTLAVVAPVFHT